MRVEEVDTIRMNDGGSQKESGSQHDVVYKIENRFCERFEMDGRTKKKS